MLNLNNIFEQPILLFIRLKGYAPVLTGIVIHATLYWIRQIAFLCHPYCTHVQWMTYCEGVILSLTRPLAHRPLTRSLHCYSICNRWLCSAGSVYILIQIDRFSTGQTSYWIHIFLWKLDRHRPNISLLEMLTIALFKSKVRAYMQCVCEK